MTDAEKLRAIAQGIFHGAELPHGDVIFLNRMSDLLDAVPPETLRALKAGTWKAVPAEPTQEMIWAGEGKDKPAAEYSGYSTEYAYCETHYAAMLAAAPKKPEGNI